jgi:hypothetical protein
MNLHDQMMNLPADPKVLAQMEGSPKGFYLLGHRDARHAAAELALSADEQIRKLREALTKAENAMTYTEATVSPGNGREPVGDWVEIHAGRARSSYALLRDAVKAARAALKEES